MAIPLILNLLKDERNSHPIRQPVQGGRNILSPGIRRVSFSAHPELVEGRAESSPILQPVQDERTSYPPSSGGLAYSKRRNRG